MSGSRKSGRVPAIGSDDPQWWKIVTTPAGGYNPKGVKQVIVVNDALQLPPGKLAAQVAHAAISAFLEADSSTQRQWRSEGMPKVVVRAGGATALRDLYPLAQRRSLPAAQIRDAGRTVVEPGTLTCLGLGPAEDEQIDSLTGTLPLV